MGNITELLRARQFQTGLVDGVFALAVVLVAAAIRLLGRRPPIAGAAFAVAGLAALTGAGPGRRALAGVGVAGALGVLLLLAGGVASRVVPPVLRLAAAPLLLVPGSVVLGLAAHHHGVPAWAALLVVVAVPPFGVLAGDFDRRHGPPAYGPLLLAITVGGVYLTVPDTEGARALLGVALPLVLLTVPRAVATLGAGGAAAAVGLIGYDAVLEGVARPGAVIGALGCLGLFLYEPVARRLLRRAWAARVGPGAPPGARSAALPADRLRAITLAAGLHLVVVLWAARVAGRVHGAVAALVLLLPAIVVGIMVCPAIPDPDPGRGQRVR